MNGRRAAALFHFHFPFASKPTSQVLRDSSVVITTELLSASNEGLRCSLYFSADTRVWSSFIASLPTRESSPWSTRPLPLRSQHKNRKGKRPTSITDLEINGLIRSQDSTIRLLLPRPLPATYSREEIKKFERRIRNLSLFDRINVTVQAPNVTVDVQEKIHALSYFELHERNEHH